MTAELLLSSGAKNLLALHHRVISAEYSNGVYVEFLPHAENTILIRTGTNKYITVNMVIRWFTLLGLMYTPNELVLA